MLRPSASATGDAGGARSSPDAAAFGLLPSRAKPAPLRMLRPFGLRPLQLARQQLFLGRVARLVDRSRARQARGALHEHDALAGGVPDLVAVGTEVLESFQDQLFAQPHHLVRGPRAVAIAQVEDVAVHFPGAGAIRDAGLLAVDRHGEREAASSAGGEHEGAALHEQMLAAAGVDHPRSHFADLDEPIHAAKIGPRPDRLDLVMAEREGGALVGTTASVRAREGCTEQCRDQPRPPDRHRRPSPAGTFSGQACTCTGPANGAKGRSDGARGSRGGRCHPGAEPGWEARFPPAPPVFYDPGARARRRVDVCFQTNHAMPARMRATMSASALWNQGVRSSRCSPTCTPTHPRPRHQGKEPMNVYAMNFPIGMRATPAGKAMKVRTTGRSRAMSTVTSPRRSKKRSAHVRCSAFMRTYLPYFSTSGRPPYCPA